MRIARTRIGNAIGSERDCENAIGRELVKEIARGIGTAEDPIVVTEIENRKTTEVAVETSRTEIEVGTVIAIEIDIGTGEYRRIQDFKEKIIVTVALEFRALKKIRC